MAMADTQWSWTTFKKNQLDAGKKREENLIRPKEFSFVDCHASIILPFFKPGDPNPPMIRLPGLSLVSLSEHRDKYPVTSLGNNGIKGFVYGNRTTAGTLGFTVFNENPFAGALQAYAAWRNVNGKLRFTGPDQLPPFDLSLVFFDETGDSASLFIRSLTIVDSSKNLSVRDIQLTDVYSFMAVKASILVDEGPIFGVGEDPAYPEELERTSNLGNPFVEKKAARTVDTSQTGNGVAVSEGELTP